MHIRGLTVPLAMAISIPMVIIKMSQLSANLNYTGNIIKNRLLIIKYQTYV